jgi:anti-anti-sigma regulatory factor
VLGVLASGSRRVREADGRLVAVNASGIVARALEITGVGELLDLAHDVDVADLLARTGPDAR